MIDLSLDEDLEDALRGSCSPTTTTTSSRSCCWTTEPCSACPTPAPTRRRLCDANFSTHLLAHWVRETGVLTLEQAVHRLTGHAANVFRLGDRGVLREGAWADLVAFDADTVGARRGSSGCGTCPGGADRLHRPTSTGIEHVWVNGSGRSAATARTLDGARPGALIRGGTA